MDNTIEYYKNLFNRNCKFSIVKKLYKRAFNYITILLVYPKIKKLKKQGFFYQDGNKIYFPSSVSYGALLLSIYKGDYEKNELELLININTEKDIILEVGGGIGFLAASIINNKKIKEYHIVEANPQLIEYIRKNTNIAASKGEKITIHNLILGEKQEKTQFFVKKDFWASSLIKPHYGKYHTKLVSCENKILFLEKINPTFLIIDIEGGEKVFFERLNLSSINKILVELHPDYIGQEKCVNLIQYFLKQGFQLKSISYPVFFFIKKNT